MSGDGGDDSLFGDVANGYSGFYNRGYGNDTISGGSGDDLIVGDVGGAVYDGPVFTYLGNIYGYGHDKLSGDGGNATLIGGAGTDVLSGGAGNDIVYGDDRSEER